MGWKQTEGEKESITDRSRLMRSPKILKVFFIKKIAVGMRAKKVLQELWGGLKKEER